MVNNNPNLTATQIKFLKDEFMSLTLMAIAQRGNLYVPGCSEKIRKAFHRDLAGELRELVEMYHGQHHIYCK